MIGVLIILSLLCRGNVKKRVREFKAPTDDQEIGVLQKKRFAPESQKKMKWAVNMYSEWRRNRLANGMCPQQLIDCNLDLLGSFHQSQLSFALSRFIVEVRRLDGKEYPPNTLREIIVCIQMFLHENGIMWKLIDGDNFVGLRNVLDNTMKERHSLGYGVRQSAEVISLAHEDKLFESGVIGLDSPQKLLHGVLYLLGMHAALRGGVEHNNLRRPGFNCQFKIEKDSRGIEALVYREDPLQKTNQGGLQCKVKPKVVYIYAASNFERDPITYFKKYTALLPQGTNCKKFYLRPKKVAHPSVWYCDQAYGVNKVKGVIKEICKKAGLDGKFTNHSLRATCATRMYDGNVPEQLIKETTGHRSECVRTYKRTGDHLCQNASSTVSSNGGGIIDFRSVCNIPSKKRKVEFDYMSDVIDAQNEVALEEISKVKPENKKFELSPRQMMFNVLKSRLEMHQKIVPKVKVEPE